MRIRTLLVLSALAIAAPAATSRAQGITINLGTPQPVALYSAAEYGAWQTNYKAWQPTTLYLINGQYYEQKAAKSRAVVVYHRANGYFLPPQDAAWVGADKRYDYKHKPLKSDYGNNGRGRGRGRGNGKP